MCPVQSVTYVSGRSIPLIVRLSFLIRYVASTFHKSMIFDIRNALYLLRLTIGRAQTRRAWRLPFNESSAHPTPLFIRVPQLTFAD